MVNSLLIVNSKSASQIWTFIYRLLEMILTNYEISKSQDSVLKNFQSCFQWFVRFQNPWNRSRFKFELYAFCFTLQ